jgi:hypothetical protein
VEALVVVVRYRALGGGVNCLFGLVLGLTVDVHDGPCGRSASTRENMRSFAQHVDNLGIEKDVE